MAECTVRNIFDDVRTMLGDSEILACEILPASLLLTDIATGGTASGCCRAIPDDVLRLAGASGGPAERLRHFCRRTLPSRVPSTYNIIDFSEPELIEELAGEFRDPILPPLTSPRRSTSRARPRTG